jgi:lipopolysaccharide/colanic/teichoic acid biosynthesis glycosyltransferase
VAGLSGRSDLSWDDSVRLDLYYVENWSPALDAMILWKTLFAVVRGKGAYCGLPPDEAVLLSCDAMRLMP